MTATGIFPYLSFADYHAIDAASNSRLGRLRQSPAHLKAYLSTPQVDTAATLIGHAVHTAILEPDEFAIRYCVASQCGGIKKDGQRCSNPGTMFSAHAGWLCGVHGKGLGSDESRVLLSGEDHARCLAMRDSVYAHPAASALLKGTGGQELTIVWEHLIEDDDAPVSPLAHAAREDMVVLCKARFDKHSPDFGAIVDVKSTDDASKSAFERSILKWGYHRQGALYLDGAERHHVDAQHFVHIAVEKEPPYAVAVYRLDEAAITAGREQLRPLLARYEFCRFNDQWPAYSQEVQDVSLPAWGFSQIDAELREAIP